MAEIVTATFQYGAFVPEQALGIAAGARVKLTVETIDETNQPSSGKHLPPSAEAIAEFDALCDEIKIHSGLRLTRDELHERD